MEHHIFFTKFAFVQCYNSGLNVKYQYKVLLELSS